MLDETIDELEKAQMRRVMTIQKVAWFIIVKWMWVFILLFVLLGGGFAAWLMFKSSTSQSRFEATTRLLFSPQKVAQIENISDRQLMSVIERPSLKSRVGERLKLPEAQRGQLSGEMEIEQERRPSNLFTLTVTAPSRQEAIDRANAYAEVLVDEYVAYRSVDLERKHDSIEARRKNILGQLAENEAEMSKLKAKTGVAAPAEMLSTLNSLISDQRRNLSALAVSMANEELRRQKFGGTVGGLGPAVIANASAIRRRSESITKLDKEIAELRTMYTDINPKVAGKLQDRDKQVKEMQAFLKEKGVKALDIDRIDEIEKAAGELAACATRMEALAERQRVLEQELKDNEKKAEQLTALVPEYERLVMRYNDLERSARKMSDDMNDITYLMSALRNDLRQVERADMAADRGGLTPKTAVLAVAGAIICVGTLLLWVVLVEFTFGKVRGGKELSVYGNMTFIGSLPKPRRLSTSEAKEILGVVALKLLGAEAPRGIMLVCRLPGSTENAEFGEVLSYTASMSGVRVFTLNVVSQDSFTPPAGAQQMVGVVRKDEQGWFPVLNRYALAPTELEMLKADLAELRNSFDTVFIRMEGGFRRGGSFFDQLLSASETAVLMVGTARTPRSWVGYVRRHVEAAGKPMLVIATDASVRTVRAEMDVR